MKNVCILMLGLLAGTASFAQNISDKTPATSVSITNDQRLKLIVAREEAVATISLRDADGRVLYTQNVNLRDGLRQYFNLAELDKGTYQVAVAVGKEITVQTFVIDEQPAQKSVALRS